MFVNKFSLTIEVDGTKLRFCQGLTLQLGGNSDMV